MKLIDLTDEPFGRLTVLSRHPENGPRGEPRWVCRCECGNEVVVSGANLRYGNTRSCGCARGCSRAPAAELELPDLHQVAGVELAGGTLSQDDFKAIQGALGFSNARLARELGISRRSVEDLRSGVRAVQPYLVKLLAYLAREYGVIQ